MTKSMSKILFHLLWIGGRQLYTNWMWTGISLVSMTVAVANVIVIASIGAGARQQIRDHVALEGVNIIYVWSAPSIVNGVRMTRQAKKFLTIQDATALKAAIPEIQDICWWRQDPLRIVYGNQNWLARVLSISPGCQAVKGWLSEKGREITEEDAVSAGPVALFGRTVAKRIFYRGDPEHAVVRIGHVPFRVIGFLAEKGYAPGGYDQDDIVLIPYTTARKKLLSPSDSYIEIIAVKIFEREQLPQVAESIKRNLRIQHRLDGDRDDFVVRTQLEVEQLYEGADEDLTRLLEIISSISLLVGGIGIMNALLASVTARTNEIGLRMAVGAKRGFILVQFLTEALTVSLFGALAGSFLGILGARLVTVLAGWPTIVSYRTLIGAVLLSMAVGLFFGLYPASRAARMNPIEALRHE